MRLSTRKLLDRAFSALGLLALALMGAAVVVILWPIFERGLSAFVFRGTIEHRRLMFEKFERGDGNRLAADMAAAAAARKPVYDMVEAFELELKSVRGPRKRELRAAFKEFEQRLESLLGPAPGAPMPVMVRRQYGQTRWDRAGVKLDDLLNVETWDYSQAGAMGRIVRTPRKSEFAGTALEPAFDYLAGHAREMLRPRFTLYLRFLTDPSIDAHFFGGILPEVLGTIYLTIGAMLVALPIGVLAAIYFTEYAREGRVIGLLRSCVSTLAGVPSIVFGLFGLAFFIHTMKVSPSKSVLAGSLTLGLLVMPTVIRSAEEAIKAVPRSYKEAAMGLGAGRWHTVWTVILPAALPGILTGVVLSMGRAAGETAPIIFTAAVSVGRALKPWEAWSRPTPALSWNVYNLCTEHEAVDEIRHVQFGMVMSLVLIVLLLNITAIVIRARVSKKLKG